MTSTGILGYKSHMRWWRITGFEEMICHWLLLGEALQWQMGLCLWNKKMITCEKVPQTLNCLLLLQLNHIHTPIHSSLVHLHDPHPSQWNINFDWYYKTCLRSPDSWYLSGIKSLFFFLLNFRQKYFQITVSGLIMLNKMSKWCTKVRDY